jgi:phospholipase/carboxylesterase
MSLNMGLRSAPGMGPAAIVSLSGFLLGSSSLPEPDQALRRTPIFLGHGTRDQVVLPLWQFEIADILKSKGFEAVQSHRYSVDHSLHPDEARDVQDFLRRLV